jgi:hypothetical protein
MTKQCLILPRPPVCFTPTAVKKKTAGMMRYAILGNISEPLTSLSTFIPTEYSENNKKRGKVNFVQNII